MCLQITYLFGRDSDQKTIATISKLCQTVSLTMLIVRENLRQISGMTLVYRGEVTQYGVNQSKATIHKT